MSNMGGGTFTHRKGEGETTEWDDILKKKGIVQPTQAELDKAAADEIRKAVEEAVDSTDFLALKSVSELNELEEEGGEFGGREETAGHFQAPLGDQGSEG